MELIYLSDSPSRFKDVTPNLEIISQDLKLQNFKIFLKTIAETQRSHTGCISALIRSSVFVSVDSKTNTINAIRQ